jgi:tRNA pseudouridine38-40 synthase
MEKNNNIKATIEYDGTLFRGWQRQTDVRTVQGELEEALRKILGHPVTLYGSGRTDTGVHALCQVANFHARKRIGLRELLHGVNSLTGEDMRVLALEHVPDDFHARFSALSRKYIYLIGTGQETASPFFRRYLWQTSRKIESTRIERPLARLKGEHDFTNLSKRDPCREHYRAIVYETLLKEWKLGYILEIRANRFLPQMVRRIVGTLVAIASGEEDPDSFDRLLSEDTHSFEKVYLAPASGLFLAEVEYAGNHVMATIAGGEESLFLGLEVFA